VKIGTPQGCVNSNEKRGIDIYVRFSGMYFPENWNGKYDPGSAEVNIFTF